MASLTAKKVGRHTYYYARQCQRVNGKPKIVWQKYLGKLDDIIDAVGQAKGKTADTPKPLQALVLDSAAIVALLDIAKRLRLVEHIDRHVPKERDGPSVGTYLLIATLNRCVAPCSKASIRRWFEDTVLGRRLEIQPSQLSSQRFWDNMDRILPEDIERIEADLVATMVKRFEVDLHRVLFDATNFFTFIDTFNQRSTLAQRGKSKQGRASLRIVGLALLITQDAHLPLLHRTYPGNKPDAPTFSSLIQDLVRRCQQITGAAEHVTLIFDKGNNSKDNLEAVAESRFNFVGSLVPTQHPELLKIPRKKFHSLAEDGLPNVLAYRTRKSVFGVERTVVVTFNDNLFCAQAQTLLREITKRQQHLQQLQQRLQRWARGQVRRGNPPTLQATQKKINGWLKARHMKDLFKIELEEKDGLPRLHYRFDHRAWERLQKTLLGKHLLFTDLDDSSDAEIVRAYRSQAHIEDAFRTMKDPYHIALRPQHHWTDQKIQVHVFYCVLALMLVSLLQREVHRLGLGGSIAEILDELGKIRQVGVLYPPQGRQKKPTLIWTLSKMTERQRALFEGLELERYLPP